MLAPPSHISTTKINSVALKGQLTRDSTALQMLCRNSEQAKVALLIFTLAVPHTSKSRSLIKALGQHRAQGEWLTGGDEGQVLQAQRNVPSSPDLYLPRKWESKYSTLHSSCTHHHPATCLWLKQNTAEAEAYETSEGFEAEATERMLFESLPERRNQTNAIFFLPVRNLFFGLLKKNYSKTKLCSETSAC